jgi:hypothetical protein
MFKIFRKAVQIEAVIAMYTLHMNNALGAIIPTITKLICNTDEFFEDELVMEELMPAAYVIGLQHLRVQYDEDVYAKAVFEVFNKFNNLPKGMGEVPAELFGKALDVWDEYRDRQEGDDPAFAVVASALNDFLAPLTQEDTALEPDVLFAIGSAFKKIPNPFWEDFDRNFKIA